MISSKCRAQKKTIAIGFSPQQPINAVKYGSLSPLHKQQPDRTLKMADFKYTYSQKTSASIRLENLIETRFLFFRSLKIESIYVRLMFN